jgi:aerobic-type carbon monoxide dehydrogenase small subunit (CoxS/CutS family)
MAGTLCRCMTYYRIQAAVRRVANGNRSAQSETESEVIA